MVVGLFHVVMTLTMLHVHLRRAEKSFADRREPVAMGRVLAECFRAAPLVPNESAVGK